MSTAIATPQAGVRNTPPFRADHVGSFLRPKFLLDAREQFRTGAMMFGGFIATAIVLGWLMYPFPL